jgi:rhodanese-related sulfurtransferase
MRPESASSQNDPRLVDFDELRRRIDDEDTSFVLLNVLPRASFEAGRIPGSVHLPLDEMSERFREVLPSPDQEVVVYCASPFCSMAEQAAVLLRGLGYRLVREYSGGIEEWTERGGRIEGDALPGRAPAPAPPAGRADRLLRKLSRLSPAAAFVWASGQPLRVLFSVWLGIGASFALLYWSAAHGTVSLVSGGAPVAADLSGLNTAFWFSMATAMSSGFGDVAAAGWVRLAVLAETAAGLVLFSALVSKIVGGQQEAVLAEVHRLTFENRLGRLRTNLHLVLTELAEIAGDCSDTSVSPRRLRARIEGVAMIFTGEMQAVRDLVQGTGRAGADGAALEALFACLTAGLQELSDLLTCLPAGRRSGPLRRSLRRLAQLGSELCGVCSTRPQAPAVREWMDRVHRLCHALCDEPRPGDPAPPFALPGSDGRVHRLEEHRGKPVILAWFPKAFTGG